MLFCTVTDDVLHNVALHKPTDQVSMYTDQFGITHAASFGNDGIVNTCARSRREADPWWTVDLRIETLVAQVNLTNRGDSAGSDLHFMAYCFRNFVTIT